MTQELFADNIRKLMNKTDGLSSQSALGEASGIDQRTVGRMLNCEHSPSLNKVFAIAEALKVEPWELLHPDTAITPEWEFEGVVESRYRALSPIAQGAAQKAMMDEILNQERMRNERLKGNGSNG